MAKQCTHLDQIKDVKPNSQVCEDCIKEGSTWVALRMCLICGNVGCCDSSPNKHARRHFNETKHPIIQSFKSAGPGQEEWRWCYIDEDYV